jgi:RNA polymerase sigma-70 factor (ECF subfamily)
MYRSVRLSSVSSDIRSQSGTTTRNANEVDEATLIERCKEGDSVAWNLLVRRSYRVINAFALGLCRNRDDAADITGQVLVRIYENLNSFRGESSFSSWLFRIVRNTFLDLCIRPAYRRFEQRPTSPAVADDAHEEHDYVDTSPSPEEICIRNDTRRVLAKALNDLPAYMRQSLNLRVGGASYAEIASTTGVSIGTVKSRLNRGRTMLSDRLAHIKDVLIEN